MNDRLPADLYLRPAGDPAPDRHPTVSLELADKISKLPGVAGVDRLRAYEISYDGMPATLASVDLSALRSDHRSNFFSGRPTEQVLSQIRNADAVVVSEPFTYKHHVRAGDTITLALGASRPSFRIADVYYDYGSERGSILMDRQTMLRYLPDPRPRTWPSTSPRMSPSRPCARKIMQASAGYRVLLVSNRDLRTEAIRIFDRTFAITYALEAVAVIVAVMGSRGRAACSRHRSPPRNRLAAFSRRGSRASAQTNSRRSRTAGPAREFRGTRSGIRALARPHLCHQQTVLRLDHSIPLAGRGSAGGPQRSLRSHSAGWFVSRASGRQAQSARGCP